MKKYFILFLSALIAFLSCSKVNPADQPGESEVSFEATAANCAKTVLTDNVKTYWSVGDAISIFDGSGNNKFTTDIAAASASATFKGNVAVSSVYYALYPYNETASLSGSTISTVLPKEQLAVDGGYDSAAALLACTTSDNTLHFLPAVSFLKMQLPEGATSVTVTGNANENIAGNVSISVSSALTVSGGSEKSVVLKKGDGSALAVSTNYYVAIKPDTYASGITITLTNSEGKTLTKVSQNSQTLAVGTIYDMGTIDGTWEGGSSDLVIFSDSMENGWVLGGTEGKVEITTEAAAVGSKSIKWTLDNTNSWSRILTLDAPNKPLDVSAYKGIQFKMKVANSTFDPAVTMFQNRPYGKDSESFYNVYSPADDGWYTVTQEFKDFTVQSGSDIFTKLNNFCFHNVGLPDWTLSARTAVIYLDDIKLYGSTTPTPPTPPTPDEDLHIFQDNMTTGWVLGGTDGKYSISTEEAYEGTSSIKWVVDSYGNWSRKLTLGLAEGNMDATPYNALSFKMKLTGMSTTDKTTFAQIQVVDADGGYTEVNVYSSAETGWAEIVYNFSDCTATNFSKFKDLCFFTPGWYAVTGTVYIDDVKFVKAK